MTTFNEWAKECWTVADDHGFHDRAQHFGEFVANLHGEVSELWEAYRASKLHHPCDKAFSMEEPLSCGEEELADILIRVFDTAYAHGIDLDKAVRAKNNYNKTRPYRHGGKLA